MMMMMMRRGRRRGGGEEEEEGRGEEEEEEELSSIHSNGCTAMYWYLVHKRPDKICVMVFWVVTPYSDVVG